MLGLIERHPNGKSGRVMLVPAHKRDANTLVPIIEKYVIPGNVIITDQWGGYEPLTRLGFNHYTVNHSKEYAWYMINEAGDTISIHTNNIEGAWRHVIDCL